MFGVRSRSFHAPHGVTVNGPAPGANAKVKRKFSWSNSRLRKASSEGLLTHRPVVLKEGYLSKPGFFRFGGKKRRWCVLRTYTQSEASLDIFMDETKGRYKGSISLDRDSNAILIVKDVDSKKKSAKQCYLSLKVGKTTHQFTTDSFRDLKEWCALLRQAMDNGSIFSGQVMEPTTSDDGMMNVKVTSNCIALLCPLKETTFKTWRLDHVSSFGQSGGILTFESCANCSDSSTSRCRINIIQEKPMTILNILERAIRSNPYSNEIHYERSILGDIYHCSHECRHTSRLAPAYSHPDLFRSTSSSPLKGMGNALPVAMDFHDFERLPIDTNDGNDSDSGLPSTPQADETMSLTGSIPSPSENSTPAHYFSPFRSPKHSNASNYHSQQYGFSKRCMSDSRPSNHVDDNWRMITRRQSDEVHRHMASTEQNQRMSDDLVLSSVHSHERIYDQPHELQERSPQRHHPRFTYAMISHDSSPKLIKKKDFNRPLSPVAYTTVQTKSDAVPQPPRERYNRLQPVSEKHESEQVIYDEPNCEHLSNSSSPPAIPAHRPRSRSISSASSGSQSHSDRESFVFKSPARIPKTSAVSTTGAYPPGSNVTDRIEDYGELPPAVPTRHRRKRQDKELVTLKSIPTANEMFQPGRRRLQSSSEVLDSGVTRRPHYPESQRSRGSMEYLNKVGRDRSHTVATGCEHIQDRKLKGSADLLARLQEEEEKLSKVLVASRKERNEELIDHEAWGQLCEINRPFKFHPEGTYYEPNTILETPSHLPDYHSHVYSAPSSVDKVLTKVASDNVRGYAYKVAIPAANTQYDVPRRTAPTPDLSKVRDDAPPKPKRHIK